jgi:flagellar motor switch protein FliN/FliY
MAGPPAQQPDGSEPKAHPSGGAAPAPQAGDKGVSQNEIDAALAAAHVVSSDAPSQSDAGTAGQAPAAAQHDALDQSLDEAAALMEAAMAKEQAAVEASRVGRGSGAELPPPPGSVPLELPDFTSRGGKVPGGIAMLNDVKLDVKIELGRSEMLIEDVLKLGEGSVVELDKLAGDPVDVLVNNRLVARGEVLVLNDNFCVRISQILSGTGLDED